MTDSDKITFLFDLINDELKKKGNEEIISVTLKSGTVLAINELNNKLYYKTNSVLLNELQKDSNSLSSTQCSANTGDENPPDLAMLQNNFHVPQTIESLLNIWKDHGLHLARKGSKTFEQDVLSLKRMKRGTFFKQFPEYANIRTYKLNEQDWLKAVSRWAKKALDPNYYPVNKGKLAKRSITWFLYNQFNGNGNKSAFLECLDKEPTTIIPPKESKNPDITSYLVHEYQSLNEYNGKLTDKDQDKFIDATNRLVEWFYSNKEHLKPHAGYVLEMRTHLMNAITSEYSTEFIKPGTFCSDQTFDKILPKYLHNMGFLRSSWQVR